jgi:putative ABC transport system ATP-binding protein
VDAVSLYHEPEAAAEEAAAPALEAIDVFRIFRSGEAETVALRGLDLRISAGELVAILGPSGCGKSTFLHLAAGLDQPSAGEIRAFGRPLGRLGDSELAGYRARQVAVVFQAGNLWSNLTAEENVLVQLRLAGIGPSRSRPRGALAAFGLGDRRATRVSALSGGEQVRVAIAACAARRAPLVLCDEPTGELDTDNEARVIDALVQLRAQYGTTVVLVTHSLRVAEVAERVIEMRDGRVAR